MMSLSKIAKLKQSAYIYSPPVAYNYDNCTVYSNYKNDKSSNLNVTYKVTRS
jgi:hypothetical protein